MPLTGFKNDIELMELFLEYKITVMNFSPCSVLAYRADMLNFIDFAGLKGFTLLTAQPEDFISFRQYWAAKCREVTISRKFLVLNSFYSWCMEPNIDLIVRSRMPRMQYKMSDKSNAVVPTAAHILKIRASQKAKSLCEAALFELLATSGLRQCEIRSIRCCDIALKEKCIDYELNAPSPYIGGMIDLDPQRGIRIKRKHRRVTYFSVLAAKMLKLYMNDVGLIEGCNLPIFPMHSRDLWGYINDLGTEILREDELNKFSQNTKRLEGFLDVHEMNLGNVSERYKNKIKAVQKSELSRIRIQGPTRRQSTNMEQRKPITMHPHALRHFFAILMYYRDYFGNRKDVIAVRDLVGHGSVNTTDIYLNSRRMYIENDRQWKQVLLGNGMDYKHLIYG